MPTPEEMREAAQERLGTHYARSRLSNAGSWSRANAGSGPPVSIRFDAPTLDAIGMYGEPRGLSLSASVRELVTEALALHAQEAPRVQD